MRSRPKTKAGAGIALALLVACQVHPTPLWAHEMEGATDVTVMSIEDDASIPSNEREAAPQTIQPLDQTGNSHPAPLVLAGSIACGAAAFALRKKTSTREEMGRRR